jgi:hypothetical protein
MDGRILFSSTDQKGSQRRRPHCQVKRLQAKGEMKWGPHHAAVVALRHCAAASVRKIRRVDREMRWR